MAKKYYVVWAGRTTGVFTDWATTHQSVDRFAGARYKAFANREDADQAFRTGAPPSIGARNSTAKPRFTAHAAESYPVPTSGGLQIFCDGACDPNPGNAGSGIAVYRDGALEQLWYGLYNPNGTNNTAELNALHHAMLIAEPAIAAGQTARIFCDSTYSINCISKWAAGWEKRGWRKAGGEIRNLGIIQAAFVLYSRIEPGLQLTHVKAHVGTEGNELADRMAMHAVISRTPELRLYDEKIDIHAILRMRAG